MAYFKLSTILALCRLSSPQQQLNHVFGPPNEEVWDPLDDGYLQARSSNESKDGRREGSVASSSCLSLRVMDGVNLT
jgi:hypothetical protein